VLPAFNVTLTPRKSFLSLEDGQVEVEVEARSVDTHPTHAGRAASCTSFTTGEYVPFEH